jgi:eukaryotic translation initiation factor 2C
LERLADADVKLLKAVLKGVRVTVSVPAGRRPARPIKDLISNVGNYHFMKGDEETTIKVRSVVEMSSFLSMHFQDYYEEKYGFRMKYPKLFGICVNVQRKVIVPAEICTIVGGQMFKKVLMPEMMAEVLQHVTRNPRERIEAIERGVNGEVSILILDNELSSDVGAVPRLQELAVFLPDWHGS